MTPASLTRGEAEARITTALAQTTSPRFIAVEAPRGLGKTTLLQKVASRLLDSGIPHAVVDGSHLGAGPPELARTFPAAVARAVQPGNASGGTGPRASHLLETLEHELSRTRPDHTHLLDLAFSYPGAVAADMESPFVLLIDEAGEAVRHAKHPGLKEGFQIIARALLNEPSVTIVASISPASRTGAFVEAAQNESGTAGSDHIHLAPMSREELLQQNLTGDDISIWLDVTGGRPIWLGHLTRSVEQGVSLEQALVEGLTPPDGFFHQECRYDYHLLVERCRGDAVVRTIMALLAREERAGLTQIARYIKTSLPTALDYLFWMLEVAMIRRDGRAYSIADPLMQAWVSVNGPAGVSPGEAVSRLMNTAPAGAPGPARERRKAPGARPAPPVASPPENPDALMEID